MASSHTFKFVLFAVVLYWFSIIDTVDAYTRLCIWGVVLVHIRGKMFTRDDGTKFWHPLENLGAVYAASSMLMNGVESGRWLLAAIGAVMAFNHVSELLSPDGRYYRFLHHTV